LSGLTTTGVVAVDARIAAAQTALTSATTTAARTLADNADDNAAAAYDIANQAANDAVNGAVAKAAAALAAASEAKVKAEAALASQDSAVAVAAAKLAADNAKAAALAAEEATQKAAQAALQVRTVAGLQTSLDGAVATASANVKAFVEAVNWAKAVRDANSALTDTRDIVNAGDGPDGTGDVSDKLALIDGYLTSADFTRIESLYNQYVVGGAGLADQQARAEIQKAYDLAVKAKTLIQDARTTAAGVLDGTGVTVAANNDAHVATQTGDGTANTLTGTAGADVLSGLAGNDRLSGGAEADTLIGGTGIDALTGGSGGDTFVFAAGDSNYANSAYDTITDFTIGSDKIVFTGMAGVNTTPLIYTGIGADLAATVAKIVADTTIANRTVFFNQGNDSYLYVKGAGTGASFDGTMVKLGGMTTAMGQLAVAEAKAAAALAATTVGDALTYSNQAVAAKAEAQRLLTDVVEKVRAIAETNNSTITAARGKLDAAPTSASDPATGAVQQMEAAVSMKTYADQALAQLALAQKHHATVVQQAATAQIKSTEAQQWLTQDYNPADRATVESTVSGLASAASGARTAAVAAATGTSNSIQAAKGAIDSLYGSMQQAYDLLNANVKTAAVEALLAQVKAAQSDTQTLLDDAAQRVALAQQAETTAAAALTSVQAGETLAEREAAAIAEALNNANKAKLAADQAETRGLAAKDAALAALHGATTANLNTESGYSDVANKLSADLTANGSATALTLKGQLGDGDTTGSDAVGPWNQALLAYDDGTRSTVAPNDLLDLYARLQEAQTAVNNAVSALQLGGLTAAQAQAHANNAANNAQLASDLAAAIEAQKGLIDQKGAAIQAIKSQFDSYIAKATADAKKFSQIVADAETATTNEDNSVTIDVLTGDLRTDGFALNAGAIVPPTGKGTIANPVVTANGSWYVSGGQIVYTPKANFSGTDEFLVTVSNTETIAGLTDPYVTYATSKVTVTVNAVNDAPVLAVDVATVSSLPAATITGTASGESLGGTTGADVIAGLAGDDTLSGGSGRDTLVGGSGRDTLVGGTDTDVFAFNAGDTGSTEATADVITDFASGLDQIQFVGMTGVTLDATPYRGLASTVDGTVTNIVADGSIANRTVFFTQGGNGWLYIKGGGGGFDGSLIKLAGVSSLAPSLTAFDEREILNAVAGTGGNDTLTGTWQADSMAGGAGTDSLSGGDGRDTLEGGAGADTMTGGARKDLFVFNSGDATKLAPDTITDFTTGSDQIQFTGMAGITYVTTPYTKLGSTVTATVDAIIADAGVSNRAVFFAQGGDGYLYVKGSGSAGSANFDGTLVKLSGVTTAPATGDLVGTLGGGTNANSGTLVSALLGSRVSDVDGVADTPPGMAVTGTGGSGTWQYSTDNGATWNTLSGTDTAARLLLPTTLVRFEPTAGQSGTATLTFRAWDRTSGTANGTADTTTGTAFSAASLTASVVVNPVAHAPLLTVADSYIATPGANVGLNISVTNPADASGYTIQISGLPTGASLSAGTSSGGVWTVTPAQLAGLQLIPPATTPAYSGDIKLTVTITATDGSHSTTTSASVAAGIGALTVSADGLYDGSASVRALNVTGGANADTVLGGKGDDTIATNDGNDTLSGDGGSDTLDGGLGIDVAKFAGGMAGYTIAASGSTITVTDTDATNGDDGTDTLTNIETLRFSDGDMGVVWTAGVATLTGTTGNDTLTPSLGSGIATVDGLAGDDRITTGSGSQTLLGGLGNDTLDGGAGVDTLDGGAGADTYILALGDTGEVIADSGSDGAVDTLSLSGAGAHDLTTGMLSGIERIIGTSGNDTVTVDTAHGVDVISVDGGAGTDVIRIADTQSTTMDMTGVTFTSIEEFNLGLGSDSISFDDKSRPGVTAVVDGDAAAGDGDTAIFFQQTGGSTFDLSGITFTNIEHVVLQAVADTADNPAYTGLNLTMIGTALADTITGGAGVDTLRGGAGADTIDGGASADVYLLAAGDWVAGDVINDSGAATDVDTLRLTTGGTVDLTVGSLASVEKVELSTSGNTIVVDMAHGVDIDSVVGGAGTDVIRLADSESAMDMTGVVFSSIEEFNLGAGNDAISFDDKSRPGVTAVVDGDASSIDSDTVTFFQQTGGSTFDLSGITFTNIEQVVLQAVSDTAENPAYTGLNLTMTGSAINDSIIGGAGTDTLRGNAGDDFLDGGAGTDTAVYAGASADYGFMWNGSQLIVSGPEGTDTLVNIETLKFSDGSFQLSIPGDPAQPVALVGTSKTILVGMDNATTYDAAWAVGKTVVVHDAGGTDTIDASALPESAIRGATRSADGNDLIFHFTAQAGGGSVTFVDHFAGKSVENLDFGDEVMSIADFAGSTVGSAGMDLVVGTSAGETLSGGGGDDVFFGGGGSDHFVGDGSATAWGGIVGGTVSFGMATTGVTAYLYEDGGVLGDATEGAWTHTFENITEIEGSIYADTLSAGAGQFFLTGGAGNDLISGNSDISGPTAGYWNSHTGIIANLSGATVSGVAANTVSDGWGGTDTLSGIVRIEGSVHADRLIGGDDANYLDGEDGADTITGGGGDDWLVAGLGDGDTVDGGTGFDTLMLDGESTDPAVSIRLYEAMKGVSNVEGLSLGGRGAVTVVVRPDDIRQLGGSFTIQGDTADKVVLDGAWTFVGSTMDGVQLQSGGVTLTVANGTEFALTTQAGGIAAIHGAMVRGIPEATYTVTVLPSEGTLYVGGTAAVMNEVISQQDIDAGRVYYRPNAGWSGSDSFVMNGVTYPITTVVAPSTSAAPLLADPGGLLAYTENSAAAPVFGSVTLTDSDSADLSGGRLVVSLAQCAQPQDVLSILNAGTITVSGGTISHSGTVIGSFTGGVGAPLAVTLSSGATPAAIDALIEAIAYHNTGEAPPAGIRLIQVELTDGDGGAMATAVRAVNVTAVDDAPTAGSVSLSTVEDTPLAISAENLLANSSDVDSSITVANVTATAGGTLQAMGAVETVTIAAPTTGSLTVSIDSVNYLINFPDPAPSTRAELLHHLAAEIKETYRLEAESLAFAPVGYAGSLTIGATTIDMTGTADITAAVALINSYSATTGVTAHDFSTEIRLLNSGPVVAVSGTGDLANISGSVPQPTAVPVVGVNGTTGTLMLSVTADGHTLDIVDAQDGLGNPLTLGTSADAWLFIPTPESTASGTITFEVSDGFNAPVPTHATVTVAATNDAPVFTSPASAATSEDTPASGTLTATDAEADSLTFSVAPGGDPLHGTLSVAANGAWTYTPDADFHGNDSFTAQVVDGNGGVTQQTVAVSVAAVNDAPTLAGTATAAYTENAAPVAVAPDLVIADVDSTAFGTLTVSMGGATADDRLLVAPTGGVTLNVADVLYNSVVVGTLAGGTGATPLTVTFNPSADLAAVQAVARAVAFENVSNTPAVGTRTLSITLSDDQAAASTPFSVDLSVQPVNDAPTVTDIGKSTAEDTPAAFTSADFSAVFGDVDGGTLQAIKIVTPPATGVLKLNGVTVTANQVIAAADIANLVYEPATDFSGTASFQWAASDGTDFSATATATLTVTAVNDAPALSAPPSGPQALSFDGVDDHVSIATIPQSYPFTVGVWVRAPAAQMANAVLVQQFSTGMQQGFQFGFADDGVTLEATVYAMSGMGGAIPTTVTLGTNIADGQWHFVSLTVDYSEVTLGADGAGASQPLSGSFAASSEPVLVGKGTYLDGSFVEHTSYFNGEMRDARVWNLAKTPAVAHTDAQTPASGSDATLLAAWPMDGSLADLKATSNGTWMGGGSPVFVGTGGPATVTYLENGAPLAVAPDLVIADVDSTAFGTLTVSMGGATADDRLLVTQTGGVTLNVTDVLYNSVVVGTLAGGTGATPLTVTFNPSADLAAVQAVARAVAFENVSQIPVSGTRSLSITLSDDQAAASTPFTVDVSVQPVNDVPTLSMTAGALTFANAGTYSNGGTGEYGAAAGDFDGDGKLDLVFLDANTDSAQNALVLATNNGGPFGSGAFSMSTVLTAAPSWFAVADMDNDGDLDIVTAQNSNAATPVLLNNGSGVFSAAATTVDFTGIANLGIADINNDGFKDVVKVSNGGTTLFLGGAGGTLTAGQALGTADSKAVDFGDIDNDGDIDLVIANWGGDGTVWTNNGSGSFTQSQTLLMTGITSPATTGSSLDVKLADFNGDGTLDIFLANRYVENFLYTNNGSGSFTRAATGIGVTSGIEHGAAAVADLDNDGDLDIITAVDGADEIYINDGTGAFTTHANSLDASWNRDVAAGDFDGDGDIDIFMPSADGSSNFWRNDLIQPPVYTENAAPVAVFGSLSVLDADDASMQGATVTIANFMAGDTLGFTDQNGITGTYNAATGVLTLTGTATLAFYQAALQSVTFSATGEAPSATDTITDFGIGAISDAIRFDGMAGIAYDATSYTFTTDAA
ncbi:MAG: tandem-95 repeat protein, partial [Pseudomonadota bacterium]